jgi:hypothetical protein
LNFLVIWGSQLPRWEDTQATLEIFVAWNQGLPATIRLGLEVKPVRLANNPVNELAA